MTVSPFQRIGLLLLSLSTVALAGCHKNSAATTPPPVTAATTTTTPAAAPAPTIALRAQPGAIDRGSATTLQWEARNATSVTITPGIGDVAMTGNRQVNPTSSVTYTASATGPGGTASDTARVTVNVPAAPPEDPSARRGPDVTSDLLTFDRSIQDVTFDYDKADIRPDQVSVLQKNAAWFKSNGNVKFTVEGHCDDRGSEEYNLGLGDRRANAVKEFLLTQGIPASRMTTISYGEERPVCRDETEDCYTKNRRAHFTATR